MNLVSLQDYDKRLYPKQNGFNTQSPLKGTSCSMLVSTNNASDPRLPMCADVYLCDNCGQDFDSALKVYAHEITCGMPHVQDTSLNDVAIEPAEPSTKFFQYLRLQRTDELSQAPTQSSIVRPKASSYSKFLSIDCCSPLGQYILNIGDKGPTLPVKLEALCSSDRRGMRSTGANGYPVTYRGPKDRSDLKRYHHVYPLSRIQKRIKVFTLKHGKIAYLIKLSTFS